MGEKHYTLHQINQKDLGEPIFIKQISTEEEGG